MGIKPKNISLIAVLMPIFFGAVTQNVYAQPDERIIKLSGNYHWGEGFGETRESAISNAKRDLIERMIVRIESETTLLERDDNQTYQIELQTTTNTMSSMELRGLNYLPAERKRDGSWESVAYISKMDFEASIAVEKDRLFSSLSIALENEKAGKLDAAIVQYMEILAATFYSPVPFYTSQELHGINSELRTFLKNKINNWVYGLEIEQENVRSLSTAQNSEFYLDLLFSYQNIRTSNLEISLNKPGFVAHSIRDGRVSIFYDLPPEQRVQPFTFTVSPIIPGNFDPEKAAILDPLLPVREVILNIDFSEIIDVGFSVEKKSDRVFSFIPEIENLSVYDIEWDFGNDARSTQTSPTYDFGPDFKERTVLLTINNSPDLSRRKMLTSSGELVDKPIRAVQTDQEPISSIQTSTEPMNSVQVGFSVPDSLKPYIDSIIRLKDGESLSNYLNRLHNRDVLEVGRRSDVSNSGESYLAVINPRNREVQEILSPVVDGYRFSLLTRQPIAEEELSEKFKGLGSVWFQFR